MASLGWKTLDLLIGHLPRPHRNRAGRPLRFQDLLVSAGIDSADPLAPMVSLARNRNHPLGSPSMSGSFPSQSSETLRRTPWCRWICGGQSTSPFLKWGARRSGEQVRVGLAVVHRFNSNPSETAQRVDRSARQPGSELVGQAGEVWWPRAVPATGAASPKKEVLPSAPCSTRRRLPSA